MLVLATACGGDDTATVDAGASGDGNSQITCDPFTNAGTFVTPTSMPDAPPAMTGGTLADGTYVLTAWDQYNSTTNSNMHKETFVFEGGTLKHAEAGGTTDIIRAGTFTTSDNELSMYLSCPIAAYVTVEYTATATSFAFVAPDDDNRVQTYTKQ